MIAMHLFNLLFLRVGSTRLGLLLTLFIGWAVVVIFVLVGPSVIETADRGPYFGISGAWCVHLSPAIPHLIVHDDGAG